jgi:PAS domain S-box-containing protein
MVRSPAELHAELDREAAVARLDALQQVTEAVLAHPELHPLLETLLQRLRQILRVDSATMLLCTEDRGMLTVRASQGLDEPPNGPTAVPLGQGIAGRVAVDRQAVIVDDVADFPVARPVLRQLSSMMVAPLLTSGDVLGVLHVGTRRPRRFEDADLHLLQAAADRVAVAIRHALLYEETRRELAQRWQVETALRESERRFRLMVSEVKDYAIFMLDVGGHITSWNEGARNIKGYEEREVLGRHFSIFYPREEVERGHPEAELREAVASGRYEEEGVRLRKDGSRFWANVVITALHDGGELVGFAKVTRDVTERLAQQRTLEENAAELEAAVEELRRRSAEAEAANRAKDDFMAVMSHELRTPLTAILGYAELMQMGVPVKLPGEAHQQVDRIQSAARHQLRMVDEILTFARLQTGAEPLRVSEVELGEVVREAVALFGLEAERRGVPIRVEGVATEVRLRTDSELVVRVLGNLLSNAQKFSREGEGEVRVAVRRLAGGGAELEVADRGVGIAPEHLKRIFEPFWQVQQTATREVDGSGLGLSVARNLADLLGATLEVESEPGTGSTFRLVLPAEPPLPDASGSAASGEPGED